MLPPESLVRDSRLQQNHVARHQPGALQLGRQSEPRLNRNSVEQFEPALQVVLDPVVGDARATPVHGANRHWQPSTRSPQYRGQQSCFGLRPPGSRRASSPAGPCHRVQRRATRRELSRESARFLRRQPDSWQPNGRSRPPTRLFFAMPHLQQ